MHRIRNIAALAVILALAVASVALAATSKVTGGTTQITATPAAATVLADNHITVSPIAPATASGTTLTFPISGGHIDTSTLRGVIHHNGGLSLSNGTTTVVLRRLTIVSRPNGAALFALVRGNPHRHCHAVFHRHRAGCKVVVRWHVARIALFTNVAVSGGKATGTLVLTPASANAIDALAGKQVASAGDAFATATVAPTLQ